MAIASWLPFSALKPLIDSLAGDGQVEAFTPLLFQPLRIWLGLLSLGMLAAGCWAFLFRGPSQSLARRAWQGLISAWRNLWRDLGELRRSLLNIERDPRYLLSLLFLFALGIYVRGRLLAQPFRYDESYTFIAFALRPFRAEIGRASCRERV